MSMPQMSRPMIRLMALEDRDVRRVDLVGDVDGRAAGRQVGGRLEQDAPALFRDGLLAQALVIQEPVRHVVDLDLRQHFLVTEAAPRVPRS